MTINTAITLEELEQMNSWALVSTYPHRRYREAWPPDWQVAPERQRIDQPLRYQFALAGALDERPTQSLEAVQLVKVEIPSAIVNQIDGDILNDMLFQMRRLVDSAVTASLARQSLEISRGAYPQAWRTATRNNQITGGTT